MNQRNFDQIKAQFEQYVIGNYGRNPVAFVHAEGSYAWDSEDNRYIDLMPGWGTTTVGHCHPRVVSSIQRQAGRLIHVDNTFYNEPQGALAEHLSRRSFGGQAFFCNSGTEAVEGAIKLARLYGEKRERYKIITMKESFHGRTFASITATGQDKYHQGYLPLLPGFDYVPFNDIDAVREAIDDETAAVLLEPIQGEGGVNVADEDYLQSVRQLCSENDVLLILDEVQTGVGRTCEWFGYQHYGIEPDIMTLAKALGGGFPVGAFVARPEVAEQLIPGTHASTFGGNPLAGAAGSAVFETIADEDLLEVGHRTSNSIFDKLNAMAERFDVIDEVRGRGMMVGMELNKPGKPVFQYCLDRYVRINCTHNTVLRLLPALNVPREAVDEGLEVLEEGLVKLDKGDL
ncbi:MAG: aspartate aminotransferase family protein [Planctomycetota bacterium]